MFLEKLRKSLNKAVVRTIQNQNLSLNKEKTIEVAKTDPEIDDDEDEEWEEEESEDESDWKPTYDKQKQKDWDPRTDKMFDIGSSSSDAFQKSLDHFNPDADITK